MKYVSIDVETTGLDRQNDLILEFGAIIEDTNNPLPYDEIPKYSCIIEWDRISGSPYAINLNQRIFKILANIPKDYQERGKYKRKHNIISIDSLGLSFRTFLVSNGIEDSNDAIKIIPAGKNFASFDKPFIERVPHFTDYISMGHRSIDPTTLYIDFNNDVDIPSTSTCLKRAGEDDVEPLHQALEDAWDVIKLLRKKY